VYDNKILIENLKKRLDRNPSALTQERGHHLRCLTHIAATRLAHSQ